MSRSGTQHELQLLAELAVKEKEERALEVSLPGCVAFTSCE